MAGYEHRLETRIVLRYGTYSQWMNSDVILKVGEAAICSFPQNRVIDALSNTAADNTPPAIGIKIGDGEHKFPFLPWVQAIAADVYNWAKSPSKPTYTAGEISGLASYLEENYHISGDITVAPRIYQIIEGTGDDANKYYLRYKENNEQGEWIIDTNHYIDLSDLNKLITWIGTQNLNDYADLTTLTGLQTMSLINNRLNYTDTPVSNQFVTGINETGGIIEVSRARPTFSNISGTAEVSQGGTGATAFNSGEVLIGNGSGALTTRPIASEIAINTHLVPNYLIKNYVDNAVAGLSGAMHFIDEATVVITNGSNVNPNIQGYNFANATPGDVILYGNKEFVWTGSNWRELGDEFSYAVKGSIKDADIDVEANIAQSKIAGLSDTFNTKVDKVSGKTLTSNDFTDELKLKLENIQDGAQRNTIEHILVNGTEIFPTIIDSQQRSVNLEISEFDETAQLKLASIEQGAQVNKIEKIIYDGTEVVPNANKVITITPDPHTEHENKIESIFINGTEWIPNQDKEVRILIDQAALNLNVLEGATMPNAAGSAREEVPQLLKKLQLERIAVSGDVKDLRQTNETYITFNCGSSTEVI